MNKDIVLYLNLNKNLSKQGNNLNFPYKGSQNSISLHSIFFRTFISFSYIFLKVLFPMLLLINALIDGCCKTCQGNFHFAHKLFQGIEGHLFYHMLICDNNIEKK